MITVREVMQQRLESNGMFDTQAIAVIKTAEAEMTSMAGNWGKEADGYPKAVIVMTWLSVKAIALKWIEENAPQAWYKPAFE
nr:hypothetical protein [Vibrio splendidus]MCC4883202.1 hypothetical protein [Vibrio splendidus]